MQALTVAAPPSEVLIAVITSPIVMPAATVTDRLLGDVAVRVLQHEGHRAAGGAARYRPMPKGRWRVIDGAAAAENIVQAEKLREARAAAARWRGRVVLHDDAVAAVGGDA